MGVKKISLGALAIVLCTFAIALPSAKPVSLYVSQVMHNSNKAEADRLFKLGEQQIKDNQPKAALESFQKALLIYQQIKERLAEGHTHKNISNAYFFLKDFPQALTHQQQALSIAREIKNPDLEARALLNLGIINLNAPQGNIVSAIDFYQQSLAISRASKNSEVEQKGLLSLKSAIELFEKSLVIVRDTKDKRREINILVGLGHAYTAVGEDSKAIAPFEQALAIARELKDTELETAVLQSQGKALGQITYSYFVQGDYAQAIQYSEQLRAIAQKIKNPQLEVAALGVLGASYNSTGKLQKAVIVLEEQQKIFEKNQAPWVALQQGLKLGGLCSSYQSLNDYSKAISCSQQGLQIAQKYKNNPEPAIQISNRAAEFNHLLILGIVYKQKNEPQESVKYLESALAIHQELKNNQEFQKNEIITVVMLLGLLGSSYQDIGDTNKAIDNFKQQLAISIASGDILEQGKAHINLGGAYLAQNKYDVSFDHFNKAIKIAQDNKEPLLELQVYRSLSASYGLIGDLDGAIEYEETALKIAQNSNNCLIENQSILSSLPQQNFFKQQSQREKCKSFQQMEVQSLSILGSLYTSTANQKYNFDTGIKYINQGLELAQKLKLADEEATAFRYLASAYSQQGNWKNAIKYYEKTIALNRESTDTSNSLKWSSKVDLLQSLANAYAATGNLNKALQIQRDAELLVKPDSNPHALAVSLSSGGFLYFLAKDTAKAEKLLSEAIEKYDSILDKGVGQQDANRVSFFNSYLITYQTLAEVLVAQNRKEEALVISERGRARILSELLANSSSDTKNRELITQNSKISIQQIQQIAKQQNATLVEYQIIQDRLRITPSSINSKRPQRPTAKLFIWVVKPNGEIKFHQSDLTLLHQQNTSLLNLVNDTLASIPKNANAVSTRDNTNPRTFKKGDRVRLKNDFAKDQPWIVLAVNNDTLTLRQPSYPPGQTSTYPITDVVEKIGEKGSQSSANAKDRNLQQLYQLLIEPIAELLPTEEDARIIFIPQQELFAVPFPALQDPQGKYLIQKHTILTAPSIQVLQLTHQQRQRVPGSAKDVLLVGNPIMPKVAMKPGETPQQLPQLEGTEAEVKAIAPLFHAKPLIGKDATKLAILPILPKARIIHFATHGILDDLRGLGSAIALAPSGNDNGLLTAAEIFDLKLNAELVVISACNTGQGRITGDGVIGLSRSLMNAGVPSVIVSLWSVPDNSTTTLMTEFYRNLQQEKLDKARSLRKAMQTMIEKDFSPYDWAAFNLIGNAE
ncbi:CHAT domain-containing protein [Nostoc sp. ChiQUE01b]|uniref:CHAT domain-containing protein n=1 Tax=Nostoc sp. ChiQUE01b TaxID=3075376 RepID=UPI002AD43CCC|nr:CHAT domain-containing protein [Nostoc sp. ChiQUE01b]MDZ8263861.1 CHAT domain-containing protein [Nostoc sp. ChiQUE01b]